ncbi:cytochrome c oxidase subunit II [Synechococcus sp. CS-197]|uniref:cytochrome c oxidase subunit II n=1 Tax=Synechococcus sp. CS-197 TaxID=2847985 RepID=UPI0001525AE1|nr:cytochrome c oxidase subunit II [Synechococcus sp. CS-197]MCT0251698.1 cytochrome c oxidase subunit II [Synechococcus sp. CS-197]CAK23141.1 Cytochrome c oxidase subunit II [Synechococcus sp. WH 7803]
MTTSTDRKGPNIKAILIISIGVALNTALAAQMAQWSYSWFPPQASSAAPYVDDLFALETAIGSFLWFGLTAVIAWTLLFNRAPKYDESYGEPIEGNNRLEITWTIIPTVIVFAIAIYSMQVNDKLDALGPKHKYAIGTDPVAVAEVDPRATVGPIDVISRQWSWEFIYPDGTRSSELHLPVDQRVNFRLISEDVNHSFYVPAFRLKQDIIPGSVISYSLTPTKQGRFRLRDAMFSGAYFSQNQTDVIVESEDSYNQWLAATAKQPLQPGLSPGNELYAKRLANGNKGWATVPPAPPPMVNDPGDASIPHDA